MIDSINVGLSGLTGYSKGLRVIANNAANLNTPGFKGAMLHYADAFYSGTAYSMRQSAGLGHGLATGDTSLSFRQGEFRQTGNTLDLAINGQGLFTLRDESGKTTYTRDGQFLFNSEATLVSKTTGAKVIGLDANGAPTEIRIADRGTIAGRATSRIRFAGNVASTATEQSVPNVTVMDANGATRTLALKFVNTSATAAGSWDVQLLDGATVVQTRQIVFASNKPTEATARLTYTYTPPGLAAMNIELDFSEGVTSFAPSTSLSDLAATSQNGFGAAELSSTTFDETGTLVLTYANGETSKGAQLLLARFDSPDAVAAVGANQFEMVEPSAWHTGTAGGAYGDVQVGFVELSNVDLSREFSDLVIMQRGYQASSQVISTANEMLQELFAMKNR